MKTKRSLSSIFLLHIINQSLSEKSEKKNPTCSFVSSVYFFRLLISFLHIFILLVYYSAEAKGKLKSADIIKRNEKSEPVVQRMRKGGRKGLKRRSYILSFYCFTVYEYTNDSNETFTDCKNVTKKLYGIQREKKNGSFSQRFHSIEKFAHCRAQEKIL